MYCDEPENLMELDDPLIDIELAEDDIPLDFDDDDWDDSDIDDDDDSVNDFYDNYDGWGCDFADPFFDADF